MDINFISDFFVPCIVALSLCVGYVMRNFLPTDNKWIPLALLIIGAVSGVIVSGFNYAGIVSGAVSGLAAVGLNQAFKQALGLNVRPDIELTDDEVQEHELNEEEDEEEDSDDDQQAEE
ncbi:MAG: phage holin family protein [Mogibacterium sp.]|uniref:phage holin family protein n=1 Tax=Mogibacterium sp. TaxID=2049035 RepID=UPI001A5496B2|nr:phage holin family protein [Mogibacterium sp.]MBL6468781.1 phage holin family protein [Mogibacterium sp.]